MIGGSDVSLAMLGLVGCGTVDERLGAVAVLTCLATTASHGTNRSPVAIAFMPLMHRKFLA